MFWCWRQWNETHVQSPTIWQRRAVGTSLVMIYTLDQRVWVLKLSSQHCGWKVHHSTDWPKVESVLCICITCNPISPHRSQGRDGHWSNAPAYPGDHTHTLGCSDRREEWIKRPGEFSFHRSPHQYWTNRSCTSQWATLNATSILLTLPSEMHGVKWSYYVTRWHAAARSTLHNSPWHSENHCFVPPVAVCCGGIRWNNIRADNSKIGV